MEFAKAESMSIHKTRSPEELVTSCQGLVRSIAWKIHQRLPRTVDLDDLIGFGQVGLMEAARDFDQTREVRFTTYAYYRIRGAVLDGLSSMNWFTKADYARGRYEKAANALLSEADGETADELSWFERTTMSLSMSYLVTHASGESQTVEPADDNVTPADVVQSRELQSVLTQLVDELPEREQVLIRSIYFDGISIKQAGERIGISKAWASRMHVRTLSRLASRMTGGQGHSTPVRKPADLDRPLEKLCVSGDTETG